MKVAVRYAGSLFDVLRLKNKSGLRYVFGLWLLGSLAGCFRDTQPDQFYMLKAVEVNPGGGSAGEGPLIGLGPIRLPAYLDRPQIVTATSGQEYHLSESHRWAERLEDNIARVTAQNLSAFIPTDRIVMHPWPREPKPAVQVAINIQEMHVDPAGEVRMSALWNLKTAKDQVSNFRFSCRLPASTVDYARMVEMEGVCVARLNREIAETIRNLGLRGL
jgi:uncharacterized lipoprotein YmbA